MQWFLMALAATLFTTPSIAQRPTSPPTQQPRSVYIDRVGTIRWRDTGGEVVLFGANYTLPSASDYRAAGYLDLDRKKLIDEDMAQFARMGWDALRVCLWGDWENTDRAGNLVVNDHLDLADYLIARARERGIYVLLTPITTYESTWPDALQDRTSPGFSNFYKKSELSTNAAAISAQVNYIQQLLRHVNPYTGIALRNEPSILFIEMINEPTHHSADVAGTVAYINQLSDAVRKTGSKAILFHNVSQDFAIADAISRSSVQGVTFGWYPTGLNSGHELRGNYLRTVDDYEKMRDPRIARLPRIVYEFDSPDLRTGYMYPAMVRTMRSVGTQFAAMFAYDMLGTASRNLGWQTHYLNLVYTPRKAMSAVIAGEAMHRLPERQSFGPYPGNRSFGDFRVSYEENSATLAATDVYLNAGATEVPPPHPAQLMRVAGYGSSPVVAYAGEGTYFIDRIRRGVWRLEVYPDAVPVRDPFETPSVDKIVTRAIWRAWPMRIALPDLGPSFTVERIAGDTTGQVVTRATGGGFIVRPGVYLLGQSGVVDRNTVPAFVGALGIDEYHAPPGDTLPVAVTVEARAEYVAGGTIEIAARVVDAAAPDSAVLSLRRRDQRLFRLYPMRASGAYGFVASVPADSIGVGPFEYAITVVTGKRATTFPEGVRKRPWEWNYAGHEFWQGAVVRQSTPVRLFSAREDAAGLAFSRIGDGWREGIYRLLTSPVNGEPVFHLELPRLDGRGPNDYTASRVVEDRIAARGDVIRQATNVRIRLRVGSRGDSMRLTLVERDGTSWSAEIQGDTAWTERTIPLAALVSAKSAMLPEGFPGEWNYWVSAPTGRGGMGDTIRLPEIERIQFSLRPSGPRPPQVEIEWVILGFP
jgi:hypothetical protein